MTEYSVVPEGWARLQMIAGTNDVIHFALPDGVRELCVSGGCDLVFSLEARPVGDDHASSLLGEGVCPLWEKEGVGAGRIEPATAATE